MDTPDLLPVRMLNEYAYCRRLFHLMHVEGRWADNVYTLEGREAHRRVDRLDHVLPDPDASDDDDSDTASSEGDERPVISRSVALASERLGITAKLDLVSTAGDEAVPVDTKRGRVPNNPERSWEPERVQLMAQGLLLREHGFRTDHGVLYFTGSKTRVDVHFTPELEALTLRLIDEARRATRSPVLPDPLEDSPKCNGCSLAGICLPDETLALRHVQADPPDAGHDAVRRLYPVRDDALPLYIQEQGARVGKRGDVLVITRNGGEIASARLKDVSQLVLCGNVFITAQALHLLCEASVPIVHLSRGHWFYGITAGITLRNAYDRAAQFDAASNPARRLELARKIVAAKGANQRTLLLRNGRPRPEQVAAEMATLLRKIEHVESADQLLGIEGNVAAKYFSAFGTMLRPRDIDADWAFESRNRRPPRDPVNALLSFGYALLAKECTVALMAEGLDPWWGLYHQPRHGRPAFALDLMEEFRPVIVDSAVLTAINTGMVTASDFIRSNAGCVMRDSGRKAFIRAYEARLDQLATHPVFDYRCSWRSMIRLQARLLARWLRGDVPRYQGITVR
ncbi:MAG TPA: CRISPR-associated endonuclease Cas1 [Longimicrobiales bacterium]|nr:CRISPR-associated endonuclease Cas1 [Longimicrobiales bacterium]